VDFVLEGEGKTLPVSYVGSEPLPDTFVDKSQALIEGRPASEGRFVAEHVQAKCASKYEAAPGGPDTTPNNSPKPVPSGTTQRSSM
jgi:cytochrome c-type biogenesis protein CcmE